MRAEQAFKKLWVILKTHYQNQDFNSKMGSSSEQTANLWRNEFKKANIGYDEIVIIGNNLSKLERPGFIPNVFQLIDIAIKDKKDPHKTNQKMYKEPTHFMSDNDVIELREKTKDSRYSFFSEARKILL